MFDPKLSISKLTFGYLFRPKVVITIIIPQMIQHKSFEFQKKMIMLQKEKWQVAHVIPKVAHANIFVSENVSVSNSWFDLSSLSIFPNWPCFWWYHQKAWTWNIFWPPNDILKQFFIECYNSLRLKIWPLSGNSIFDKLIPLAKHCFLISCQKF